jgi:bifunctional DNA-binding transcriptional regulator/antitoxin component of YhaV-PrlF toxin-antitoxin module
MKTYTSILGKDGRIFVPAAVRKKANLKANAALLLSVVGGEVRIVSRVAAIRRMQARLAHFRDPEKSVAESLIRERREAASKE